MDPTPQSQPGRDIAPPDPIWPATDWPAGPIGPPDPGSRPSSAREKTLRRRSDRWTAVLTLLGGVLLGTGVTLGVLGFVGVLDPEVESVPATTISGAPTTTSPPLIVADGGTSSSVIDVASAAIPSIVAVEVVDENQVRGGGSGVVYRDDGYLITNHHVVADASEIFVIFSDGVGYPAELVGSDPLTDIAVLRTTRPDLAPIRLRSAIATP